MTKNFIIKKDKARFELCLFFVLNQILLIVVLFSAFAVAEHIDDLFL